MASSERSVTNHDASMAGDRDALLGACLRLPENVVHRNFVAETVILNLETGMYHGLNPMGGHMLTVLGETSTVREAAQRISDEYDQDPEIVENDVVAFCLDLLERGLVKTVDEGSPEAGGE
jgi:hypothetical protein